MEDEGRGSRQKQTLYKIIIFLASKVELSIDYISIGKKMYQEFTLTIFHYLNKVWKRPFVLLPALGTICFLKVIIPSAW